MSNERRYSLIFLFICSVLFLSSVSTLFHGFPDTERFFAEWMDERMALTVIMKFGTLNFSPTEVFHPPLYHYLVFIAIAVFFSIGKLVGLFHDKIQFLQFYFNNTHYFFLIGRVMTYIFYWLSAIMVFKICRLFYGKLISYITTLSYLLIPRFVIDFCTMRPETLLFLNASIFFYLFLKYYLDNKQRKYLFLAAFFLGISTATKYNAIFLGVIFIPISVTFLKNKNYKEFLTVCLKIGFFIFLGFFICDPFFIIHFGTYFHNLATYSRVEAAYYWGNQPAAFGLTHIKELNSLMYINLFGFLILLLGAWRLFRKDKRLFILAFFPILIYEFYFIIFQRYYSPLRYLNPLLPIIALIFSSGVDFVITLHKKLILILAIFGLILFYNYCDIWWGLSARKTYIQKARAFIEKTIPEFTTICVTSRSRIPQLNMTRESYSRFIKSPFVRQNIKGHEICYKKMDDEEKYDGVFKELRIASLAKRPQYNLIEWSKGIKTEEEAVKFLNDNNIKYIISIEPCMINNKKIENTEIASLVAMFEPKNKRVWGWTEPYLFKVYLYKVK